MLSEYGRKQLLSNEIASTFATSKMSRDKRGVELVSFGSMLLNHSISLSPRRANLQVFIDNATIVIEPLQFYLSPLGGTIFSPSSSMSFRSLVFTFALLF
jgi:hypothetical protein